MDLEWSPLPRLPCEGWSPRRASPSFWAVWHRSRGLCHSHSPRNPQHYSQRRSITQGCAGLLGGPPPWRPRTCGKSFQGLRGRDPDSVLPFAARLCGCHLSGPGFSRCSRALASPAQTYLLGRVPLPGQGGRLLVVRDGGSTQKGVLRTHGAGGTCWPENRSGSRTFPAAVPEEGLASALTSGGTTEMTSPAPHSPWPCAWGRTAAWREERNSYHPHIGCHGSCLPSELLQWGRHPGGDLCGAGRAPRGRMKRGAGFGYVQE